MAVLIPWQATKFQEVLEWVTDAAVKYNGSEELTRIRNLPRQSFDVELKVPNSDIRRALDLLESNIREICILPIWSEATELGSAPAGATQAPVTTANFDYRNDWACFWSSSDHCEVAAVSSVITNYVNHAALTLTYGRCLVMPAREFRVIGNIRRKFNGQDWLVSFEASILDSIELPSSPASTQFKGEDLFLDPRLKSTSWANGNIRRDQEILDFGLGGIYSRSVWDRTKQEFPYHQVLSGSVEKKAAKTWLFRRGGQSRCFWAPTWEDDLRLLAVAGGGLVVSVSPNCAPKNATRHLAIRRLDGSWECRQIVSVSTSGGIFLTLDQPVSSDLSTVSFASWLVRLRLDADRIEIEHGAGNSAVIDVGLIESWSGSDEIVGTDFLWLDGLVGEIGGPYPRILDAGTGVVDWGTVTLYDYETP